MKSNKQLDNQIEGQMMVPCLMSEEAFENTYRGSEFWIDTNFFNEYRKHIIAMEHVASCAKIYILKNYKSIVDWSKLDVIVVNGSNGASTEYFNHTPFDENQFSSSTCVAKIFKRIDNIKKEKHNPITSITDVILDPTDGDFSLTINGKEHYWIQDEAIIIIANHIEQQLKIKK